MTDKAPSLGVILRRVRETGLARGVLICALDDGRFQASMLRDISTAQVGIDADPHRAIEKACAPPYGTPWAKHLKLFKGMDAI